MVCRLPSLLPHIHAAATAPSADSSIHRDTLPAHILLAHPCLADKQAQQPHWDFPPLQGQRWTHIHTHTPCLTTCASAAGAVPVCTPLLRLQVCSTQLGNQTTYDMSVLDEGTLSIPGVQTAAPSWYGRASGVQDAFMWYPEGAPITQVRGGARGHTHTHAHSLGCGGTGHASTSSTTLPPLTCTVARTKPLPSKACTLRWGLHTAAQVSVTKHTHCASLPRPPVPAHSQPTPNQCLPRTPPPLCVGDCAAR